MSESDFCLWRRWPLHHRRQAFWSKGLDQLLCEVRRYRLSGTSASTASWWCSRVTANSVVGTRLVAPTSPQTKPARSSPVHYYSTGRPHHPPLVMPSSHPRRATHTALSPSPPPPDGLDAPGGHSVGDNGRGLLQLPDELLQLMCTTSVVSTTGAPPPAMRQLSPSARRFVRRGSRVSPCGRRRLDSPRAWRGGRTHGRLRGGRLCDRGAAFARSGGVAAGWRRDRLGEKRLTVHNRC